MNLQNPVRTANKFGIEEIINPENTRSLMCAWAKHVYETNLPERRLERACGKIKPSYR